MNCCSRSSWSCCSRSVAAREKCASDVCDMGDSNPRFDAPTMGDEATAGVESDDSDDSDDDEELELELELELAREVADGEAAETDEALGSEGFSRQVTTATTTEAKPEMSATFFFCLVRMLSAHRR